MLCSALHPFLHTVQGDAPDAAAQAQYVWGPVAVFDSPTPTPTPLSPSPSLPLSPSPYLLNAHPFCVGDVLLRLCVAPSAS
jgi:hypothetical protein